MVSLMDGRPQRNTFVRSVSWGADGQLHFHLIGHVPLSSCKGKFTRPCYSP